MRKKAIVNRLSNPKQINAHIFHLIVSLVLTRNKDFGTPLAFGIAMLPRFLAFLPSLQNKGLKIYGYFYDFVNNLPIAFIAFYCKIRLAQTYGTLAQMSTIH